ncbi:MAG: hypothetical protein C0424_08265 [Sphingobacteriaceae bacterium]|nr:hypothetical protein [Sphingobacteriaceae bacterium]
MKLGRWLSWRWALWLTATFVLLLGMRLDVMEVDSAQYASIAREMLHNGEWLEVYEHGRTYNSRGFPDKPPLLFWTGAVGMWLVGENNWGFKLLATLIGLLGIVAVGRWATLLFGEKAKWPARIFYSMNAGYMLMHLDLRTDAMLVHFIAISCWQLELYFRNTKKRAFLGAFTALALGMLAKGPVALIALLAAFGADALLRADWKRLFRAEWLLGLCWVLLLLSPMLYGLYTQWGWEKGIRYYFWTQSFGRITGENVWENNLPVTYLLENFAWAFLPWVPAFAGMVYSQVRQGFAALKGAGKAVPAFGFVLMLTAMSMSKYKLPHYVYVCWPFAAVWLAGWWAQQKNEGFWLKMHGALGGIISLFTSFLLYWVVGLGVLWSVLPTVVWLALLVGLKQSAEADSKALLPAAWALVLFGFIANGFVYPAILPYQSAASAGKWTKEHGNTLPLFYFLTNDESAHAIHFYSGQVVQPLHLNAMPNHQQFLVYTTPENAEQLAQQPHTRIVKSVEFPYFKVSSLNLAFINASTRASQVEKRVLLTVTVD